MSSWLNMAMLDATWGMNCLLKHFAVQSLGFSTVFCMFTAKKIGMNTFPMLQASAVARGPKAAIING